MMKYGKLRLALMIVCLAVMTAFPSYAKKKAENAEDYGVEADKLHDVYDQQKRDYENAFANLMNKANKKAEKYEGEEAGYAVLSEGFLLYMGWKKDIQPVLLTVMGVAAVICYFIGGKYPRVRRAAWLLVAAGVAIAIATAVIGIYSFNEM